jgi:hypothetical protein
LATNATHQPLACTIPLFRLEVCLSTVMRVRDQATFLESHDYNSVAGYPYSQCHLTTASASGLVEVSQAHLAPQVILAVYAEIHFYS